jgi:multidrug efflux pump subunit AcrA (membrane-fusion protein)
MEKHTDIHLTNNEVKDILGTPPKWILRWGNLVLLLIMVILASGSIFIRHPEMVVGKVEIVPIKKMAAISIPLDVTIDTVLVKDGALVTQGEALLEYRKAGGLYTVIAPETGHVSVEQLLAKGVVITQDSTVMTIDPSDQTYAVKGVFPAAAITKMYPGQALEISMDDYPKEDFGVLGATVLTKPTRDSVGNTLITIQLNYNSTSTNYGKTLPIRTLLRGTGYTIVSNKRLIAWLISK